MEAEGIEPTAAHAAVCQRVGARAVSDGEPKAEGGSPCRRVPPGGISNREGWEQGGNKNRRGSRAYSWRCASSSRSASFTARAFGKARATSASSTTTFVPAA